MSVRRLQRDEIGQRGSSIYESKLRDRLESNYHGQFVAIDVESDEYEIDKDSASAANRLWTRLPDAQVFIERIGYPAAFHAYVAKT